MSETITKTGDATPQDGTVRDLARYGAAAGAIGILLYFGGVSLRDMLFHPIWSLGRMLGGLADELPSLMISLISGAVLVAPVWLLMRLRRERQ
jgi:hypothetical protein